MFQIYINKNENKGKNKNRLFYILLILTIICIYIFVIKNGSFKIKNNDYIELIIIYLLPSMNGLFGLHNENHNALFMLCVITFLTKNENINDYYFNSYKYVITFINITLYLYIFLKDIIITFLIIPKIISIKKVDDLLEELSNIIKKYNINETPINKM